jgi:hypothetical protein
MKTRPGNARITFRILKFGISAYIVLANAVLAHSSRIAFWRASAATNARATALEETRDALRIRAERAESDLDTARTEIQRLACPIEEECLKPVDVPGRGCTFPDHP